MKRFLIVGNINAITYANVFPYIKSCEVHYRPQRIHKFENGAAAATWYTTLIPPYIPPLVLTKSYTPEAYPRYDNYNAIEVSKTKDIPYDYQGVMGVPVTFLDRYSPNQFEIVGATESEGKGFSSGLWIKDSGVSQPLIDGKRIYKRLFIRHRK